MTKKQEIETSINQLRETINNQKKKIVNYQEVLLNLNKQIEEIKDMKNNQKLTNLENKAKTAQLIINNRKQEIDQYETALSALIEANKNDAVNSEINTK